MKDFDKQYREISFKLKKIREDIAQLKKKQHTLINVQKHFMKCCECGKYFKKEKTFLSEEEKYICPYCGGKNDKF